MAIKFAFKVVLTSTVVYWTNQWEVWSQLDVNKKRAYEQLLSCSQAIIQKNTPEALKFQIPSFVNRDLCALSTHYYNEGVLNSFDFLVNIPTKACSLYNSAVQQLNTPPPQKQQKEIAKPK